MKWLFSTGAAIGVVLAACMPVEAAPFTISANFTGTDLSAVGAAHFPWVIVPDTMGAVGPDHVAELINTSFAVYDKTGALESRVSLKNFWENALANAGTAATIRGPFDPRLLYDPSSSRWFAVTADMKQPGGFTDSQLFVGVTTGSDPSLENWRGFAIDMDATGTLWADFPTIGLDQTALYVSNNMFPLGSVTSFNSVSLVGVPRASLTAETPSIDGYRLESGIPNSKAGFRMQPAVDLDGGSSPLEALGKTSNTQLKRTLIPGDWIDGTSNIPNPAPGDTLSYTRYDPPLARQPGPYDNIHSGANSLSSNVVLQNGSLWAVQGKNVSGRAAFDFLEIDGTSPTATFRQQITISDPSLDLYYPSVAVNDLGDVVIGFSGSDNNTPISTYVVVGTTTDGVTQFGPITQTHAGSGEYFIFRDELGRNRWGDYSATVLDPVKPRTFWTFQEFVNGNMESPPFYDNWAIRITEITVGEAAGVAGKDLVPEPATWALLLVVVAAGLFNRRRLFGFAAALGMVVAGAAEQGQATEYFYSLIDYPGATETETLGLNDAGQIVGAYRVGNDTYQSFILTGDVFTPFEHPDAVSGGYMSTWINDINSAGQIVGAYERAERIWRGFLYDGADFVDVQPLADSPGTFPGSLNDSGQVAGYYNDGSINRGFLFDGTSYTTFNNTNASQTFAEGINNAGVIVGYGWGGSDMVHAFRREANGTQENFWVENMPAFAAGINDSGQIVGVYGPGPIDHYGFVLTGDIGSTPDTLVVPGAAVTEAHDINNLGQVVGWYSIDGILRHGFLATPIPEIPGDYNCNGVVDAADYVVWRHTLGSTIDMRANGDDSGASAHVIDAADYDMWRAHFGETTSVPGATGSASVADAAIPEPRSVAMLVLGGVAIALCWRRQRRAQLCSAVILSFAFTAAVAAAKPVDMAWWSLEGDLHNSADEVRLYFALNDAVDSSKLLYGRTYSHAGGINAVDDSISAGGFDPVLQLHDVSGGGESTIGVNDDGFLPLPPDWSLDSFLTWPGIAPAGGAIDVDPLPAGSYRLDLSAYDPSNLDGTSAWAMDFCGPGPAVEVTGIATTGGATVRSLKLGSFPRTEARFHVTQPSVTIREELVVGTSGVGNLIVDPGSSLSTPGINIVGDHGTALGYASVGAGGAALWEAGESLTLGLRDGARGELTVSDGSRVSANVVILGAAGSAHGTATIENPDSKLEALSVAVGGMINSAGSVGVAGGTGTLNIRDGGALDVTDTLKIWPGGTLVLSDPSSKITAGQLVKTGGTFDWTAGTLHINGDWPRIDSSGSSFLGTSTLTVDSGMRLKVLYPHPNVALGLNIGGDGSGSLTIQNGGVVESFHGGVGELVYGAASAHGTVVVTGTGSRWTLGEYGSLFVGVDSFTGPDSGAVGELSITDGGQVSAYATGIGTIWGYGTVTVDGTDSALTSTWVSVGGGYITDSWSHADGVGRLTVKNGATVNAPRQLWINSGDDTVELLGGQINAGSVTNRGGTVTGSGTVFVSTEFTNAGIVAPGPSVGLLNVSGNFVQDSAGTLSIELGGISPLHYDRLNVLNGTAALGGTLAVSLLPGFIPKSGNSFQILTADEGRSGTFASEILPQLGGGLFFDVLYDTNAVTLAVAGILGDYGHNGVVDADDYVVWRSMLGSTIDMRANGDNSGESAHVIDQADYDMWRAHFGEAASATGATGSASADTAIPEPASLALIAIVCMLLWGSGRSLHQP